MVIKLYISGISGNKEVKKKQQRVQMILDSKQITYEAIDITEPGKEKDKEFMQQNGKVRESLGKYPLPPQIFNDDDFCGDYEDFDMANEVDELEKFLHIEASSKDNETNSKQDEELGNIAEEFNTSNCSSYNPYEYHTIKIKCDSVNGLRKQISNDLTGENEQIEEAIKSEVNGESEAVHTLKSSSESHTENVEPSAEEFFAPEREESASQENETNDKNDAMEQEENLQEKEEHKVQGEEAKDEEIKEVVEDSKKDYVEEKSPPLEEKEKDDENTDKEEIESEKEEENESDESPQAEKSQEE